MRWARIERNGAPSYAIVEGDNVLPVDGSPFGEWQRSGETLTLAATKLLVPVIPPTFYAAGLNYAEHIREVAAKAAGYSTLLSPERRDLVVRRPATLYKEPHSPLLGKRCRPAGCGV